MIGAYKGIWPKIDPSVFIEETAVIVGDVVIGPESSVWFHAVVRGDVNLVRIGARTNIQDLSMLHVHGDHPLIIGDEVTVGHAVKLHGCTIKDRCLLGIGAIVLDGAVVGEEAVIAAGALVPEGMIVPPRMVAMGVPAKVKREVTEEELAWIRQSAANYVGYAKAYRMGKK
ncbi:MAG: gamma carbonic anhydrase family protein [Nitrospirae bacterium]|nr:gamma carbonic anhydrase family protein [Nitrospirota bacterium]